MSKIKRLIMRRKMKVLDFIISILLALLVSSTFASGQISTNKSDVSSPVVTNDSYHSIAGPFIATNGTLPAVIPTFNDCKNAAELGDVDSQITCGYLLEVGLLVPQNFQIAAQWYQRAASQGSAIALFRLGILFAVGKGVVQSDSLAEQYWQNSANLGYEPASRALTLWNNPGMEVCTLDQEIDPRNPTPYLPLKPGQWRIDFAYSPLMVTKQYAGKKQCEVSKTVCVRQAPNLAPGEVWPDERNIGPETRASVTMKSSTEKEVETEGHGSFSRMKIKKYSDELYEVTNVDHMFAEIESFYLRVPSFETSQTIKASYVGICQ